MLGTRAKMLAQDFWSINPVIHDGQRVRLDKSPIGRAFIPFGAKILWLNRGLVHALALGSPKVLPVPLLV